jgi:hypothetical protein
LTHGPVEAKGGEEWAGVTLVAGGFDGVQQPDGVCCELAFCHLSWHMAAVAKHRISRHRSRDDRRPCRRENGAPRHRSHCKRGAWQGSCTPIAPSQPPDPSSGAALGRCSGTAGTRETTRRPHRSRSVGCPSRPRPMARQGERLRRIAASCPAQTREILVCIEHAAPEAGAHHSLLPVPSET